MNGSHDRSASGPEYGHRSEATRCGLLQRELQARLVARDSAATGVSKFAGSARTTLGAERSVAVWAVQRYHHAMSCGFTNDTVVHHGRFGAPSSTTCLELAAISGSARQPCPGPPSGDG